jgi:hypothetical protein
MTSIWTSQYRYFSIRVENTLFNGERLYVNDELQDQTFSLVGPTLTGHVFNEKEEKVNIKVRLGGWWKMNCSIFINDKEIGTTKIR